MNYGMLIKFARTASNLQNEKILLLRDEEDVVVEEEDMAGAEEEADSDSSHSLVLPNCLLFSIYSSLVISVLFSRYETCHSQ